jgi:hypothetical protein
MNAVPAFHPGKTVAQVPAVRIRVDDLPQAGTKETMRPFKFLFVPLYEGFKMSYSKAHL